jgi:NADH:ubiquinone oxidoreductase subunit E
VTATAAAAKPSAEPDLAPVAKILAGYPKAETSLIQVLQDVNRTFNYLPCHALELVARELGVPLARVFSVATFYKAFSVTPRGKVILRVCQGTACHIRGAPLLVDEFQRHLGIKPGETTENMAFTLETVNCVGACAMAPVVIAGTRYHGELSPAEVPDVIKAHDHAR